MVEDHHNEAMQMMAAKIATYGGGASAFIFGMTANEMAAVGGLAVAFIGLCVQIYFNRRRDHREEVLHRAQMAQAKFDEYLSRK